MNGESPHIYQFDDFSLDADSHAFYHRGSLIEAGGKKMLQILAVFLRNPNELVSHYDVLDEVWGNDHFGVTSDNVNQYISQIRGVLSQFEPDQEYFKNKKGLGYIFTGEVKFAGENILPADKKPERSNGKVATKPSAWFSRKVGFIAGAAAIILVLVFSYRLIPRQNEEDEVRRVVKESQMYESLVLYKDPPSFKETDLYKYWMAEQLDTSANYDRNRIKGSVKKLFDENQRYGEGTKCEQFEFQSVIINESSNYAVVKTLEKWFLAVYFTDGTLQKNKYVGPYFVSYILRKVDGRWLIEKSTTARIIRPTPRLSDIEAMSEMKAGQQFFVRITGQDFEAETVYVEIVGPGCPENKPCKLAHTALIGNAKLSETSLENVPLTLASGDFRVFAHNGDSQASNPVYLSVH